MKPVTEKIKEEYQKKFNKYGIDPKSLFWASKGAAHQRFRQMWAEIDFNGKSVLDVGCGFGEMAKLFDLTDNILAFNMLGGHPAPENESASNIWYADSLKILEYCTSLTRRVIL